MCFRSRKFLWFLLLWSCPFAILYAYQTSLPDSLAIIQLLKDAKEIRKENKDSAFILIAQAKVIAKNSNLAKQLGDVYKAQAATIKYNGVFLETLPVYQKALQQYRITDDSLGIAFTLSMLGACYMVNDESTKSIEHFLGSVNIYKKYPDRKNLKTLIGNYRNLGNVYRNLADYEQAKNYFNKGIEIAENLKDTAKVMDIYDRLGLMEYERKNYKKSLDYLQEVINFKASQNQTAGHSYRNLANTLIELNRDEEALFYYGKAIEFVERRAKVRPVVPITTYLELADFHKKRGHKDEAIALYNKTLSIIEAHPEVTFQYRGDLMKRFSEIAEEEKDFEKALSHYKVYEFVKDSLSIEKSNNRLSELRAVFETEQKESEINQLKILEAERTKERNFLIVGVALLALLGSYILFLLNKNRKRLETQTRQKKQIENLLLEKNQLYENLQNTQDQLIHNEKMISLGQLTAGIAHEINNPVNFVSASTQALNMDFEELRPLLEKIIYLSQNGKDEKAVDEIVQFSKKLDLPYLKDEIISLLGSVSRGAARTEKIVAGLKIYSRKQEAEAKPSDINNCLQEVISMLGSQFNDKVTLHQDLAELPLVNCQIDKLHQVFLNLVGNAVDALEGEGTVFVKTQKRTNSVIIHIQDTGHGIDETIQQKIFEPFFTTKKVGKGTGLGLFISYGIIKQHGGTLDVKSKKGEGTTFSISLPIKEKK